MTEKDSDVSNAPVAAGTIAVVGELIKAAGKNPDVKKAGGEVGKAVLTVATAVNICLLPIAALNFGYKKARAYFEDRFQPDLEERLADVPPEDVVEPKPSLAGPVMQGLAFSHDEDALREMYLNLLASAMNKKTSSIAHPAFVEIIKQLSAEEAGMLCGVLAPPPDKDIVQVRLNLKGEQGFPMGGYVVLHNHLMAMGDRETHEPKEVVNLPVMVDNWIRLGVAEVTYDRQLQDPRGSRPDPDPGRPPALKFPRWDEIPIPARYKWAQERPEFKRVQAYIEKLQQQAITPEQQAAIAGKVVVQPGIFHTTAFGTEFARAVKLDKILVQMIAQAQKAKAAETPIPSSPEAG